MKFNRSLILNFWHHKPNENLKSFEFRHTYIISDGESFYIFDGRTKRYEDEIVEIICDGNFIFTIYDDFYYATLD